MIGPSGAVLAIPLTLLTKALLLDVDPSTQWISGLTLRRARTTRGPRRRRNPQREPAGGPGSATSSGDAQKPSLTAPQP